MDSCSWIISYGIDSFVVDLFVMYNFEFDVWYEFWMKGIFRIKYVFSKCFIDKFVKINEIILKDFRNFEKDLEGDY